MFFCITTTSRKIWSSCSCDIIGTTFKFSSLATTSFQIWTLAFWKEILLKLFVQIAKFNENVSKFVISNKETNIYRCFIDIIWTAAKFGRNTATLLAWTMSWMNQVRTTSPRSIFARSCIFTSFIFGPSCLCKSIWTAAMFLYCKKLKILVQQILLI